MIKCYNTPKYTILFKGVLFIRKIVISVLALAALAFTACSGRTESTTVEEYRTAITAEEFTSIADSLGFSVQDVSAYMHGNIIISLTATNYYGEFQVGFTEFEEAGPAYTAFNHNSSEFDRRNPGQGNAYSGQNWASFEKTAGGTYCFMIHIEETFVYVQAPEEHAEAISDFVRNLGYSH